MNKFLHIIKRDILIGWYRKNNYYLPIIFQLMVVTLFPLGLGAGAQQLQNIAPAIIWILAMLSSLLTLEDIFKNDYVDGSLEIYYLDDLDLPFIVIAKAIAHWIVCGVPIILFSPIIGILLHLPLDTLLVALISLIIGTPIISLFGCLGSTLIMPQKGGSLLPILILPLLTPILIFGAGAILEASVGNSPSSHLLLLGALLIFSILLIPFACSAVIKANLE